MTSTTGRRCQEIVPARGAECGRPAKFVQRPGVHYLCGVHARAAITRGAEVEDTPTTGEFGAKAVQAPVDEQHPTITNTFGETLWQAHCNVCGLYVEDLLTEPPADYLCGGNVCESEED